MKIAITGHTKGLGLELFLQATKLGFNTVGFSRSNNYNITIAEDRKRIIKNSEDCDIFINNAYDRYGQLDLLYEIYESWKIQKKLIITIGSLASNAAEWRLKPCLYSTVKKSLDIATYQLINSHDRKGCKLMIFKPGYLGPGSDKIPYNYAANYLLNSLINNTFETTEIVLRPHS